VYELPGVNSPTIHVPNLRPVAIGQRHVLAKRIRRILYNARRFDPLHYHHRRIFLAALAAGSNELSRIDVRFVRANSSTTFLRWDRASS